MYEGSSILLDLGSMQVVNDKNIRNRNYIDTFQNTISEFIRTFIMGLSIAAVVWLTMNGIARKYHRTSVNSDRFANAEHY